MVTTFQRSLSVLVCILLCNFVSFAQEKETPKTPTTIPTEQPKNPITKEQKPSTPIVDKKNDGGTGDAGDGKDDGDPKDPDPDPKKTGPQSIVGSPNNASQSPTASAEVNFANRFQDIPVNLFTGTPQIGFPIYTLSEGSLSVPITMSYNASGMKAHELASWCGLNWQISAGVLMVNRIVRGIPDEGKLEYIALGNNNSTTRKGFYQWGVKAGNDEENDPEPDIYFFTVNGMSYKFTWVKDANGTNQASFFPEADIKVSVTYEHIIPLGESGVNSSIGRFKNWKFLMPDGTTYLFATRGYADTEGSFEVEAKTAYNNGIYSGGSELTRYVKNNQVTSAWYLTQMASSYGHKIDFYYKQSQYSFFKLAEQEIQTNNCDLTGLEKNVNRVFVNGATISLIESKNIQVEFNKGVTTCYIDNDPESPTYEQEVCNTDDSQIPNRADIDTWSRVPSFSSGGKLLSNIVVHDRADAVNKLEWKFNYSYFNSGGTYGTEPYFYPLSDIQTYLKSSYRFRLKLDKITLPDNNNYQFDYYGGDFDIPSRMTIGVDHWGFMNGAAGGSVLIGHDEYRNCTSINSSTRSATVAWSQYGTLQKIKSSIGSETSFVYENHTAYNYLDVSNNPKLVGGSRVTEIRNKDLISGIETLKKYDYNTTAGTTSGFMVLKPIYHWYAYPGTTEYVNSGLYGMLLSESGRPAVGYNRVTEKIVESTGIAANNLGSTVTDFDQLLQEINVFDGATGYIRPYRSFVPFHEYRIGSPKKITVKNSSGQTLSEKEYTYSTALTTIPNLSAFRSFRLNNVNYNFQRGYTQGFSKYRLSSETSRAFSQDGTNPVENTITYTYKDEMDNTYKTNYPGKHNQVVKTTTTDSYGYSIVSQNKITADFDFGLDYTTVCYNMSGQEVDCNDMDVAYSVEVASNHEPTNTEAKGIFKALKRHILYAPVESFTTKNGNLIGASYQTYYGDSTATHKPALSYQSFGLENVPKDLSAFTEVLYTKATEAFPKDADYDLKGTTNEYNSLGFPTKMTVEYGSTSKTDYDVNEVLPIKTYNNLGEYSEQTQEMTYSPIIFGVKKQTSANGLELNNEYYSDGKLKQQTDKDGNVLKHIEYVYKGNDDLDSKVTTDNTYNRIITRVPRIATSDATNLDYQDCMISVQYKDGSGRGLMSVDYKASPNAKDLISGVVIYDSYGRPSKTYLPVESTKADGSYTSPATVLTDAIAFYNDDNPFTEIKEYEASPMSRVFNTYGAGKAWRDNSKYTQSKYETATGIKKMTLAYNSNNVTISTYSTYELSKNTSIDERGSTVTTYTDKSGNTIQREVQVDDTNYLITRYLYDDAGRMRYILPPKAYNALGSLTSIPDMETWSEFNENVYANHFDGRSRIFESHKPGIGWSRMIYSRTNQPILAQDSQEATTNTWNFVKMDGLGRTTQTGQFVSSESRATLQSYFDSFTYTKQFEERSTVAGHVQQYTNRSYPSTLATLITDANLKAVNYFDDYLWEKKSNWDGGSMEADYDFQTHPFGATRYTNSKGLGTGTKIKHEIWGNDNWFSTILYFDNKNRMIQNITTNHVLKRNQSDSQINFIGETIRNRNIHRKDGMADQIITHRMIYDNVGRNKEIYYTLTQGAVKKIDSLKMVNLSYDNIGRLISKGIQPSNSIGSKQTGLWTDVNTWLSGILPTITDPVIINQGHIVNIPTNQTVMAGSLFDKGTLTFQANSTLQMGTLPANNTNSALQIMTYSYNIKGQMIGVNLDASGNVSTSADRLFSYKLDYHEDSRYFDGSISKQTWKTNPITAGGASDIRSYEYTYDRANRLTFADYNGTGAENYDVSMAYDVNGNIQTLQRYSKTGANSWGMVDNLTYSYLNNGNRLQKIDDAVNGNLIANDFRDVGGNDYTFSVDGKLTADGNKSITSIEYNFLDLVKKITFADSKTVEYWYSSTGKRIQRKVSKSGINSYTIYDGGMVYTYIGESPSLAGFGISEIQNKEGRYVNGKLIYGYTDHVGNLRLSFKDSLGVATIVQAQSYDCWSNVNAGTEYQLSGSQEDKYLVSGKESDNETGNILLDWRDYDSVTGRMNSFDPADQSASISGFAYSGNNPVMMVDPNGRVFFLAPFLASVALGALKGAAISAVTTMISNGLHGRKFDTGLGQSMIAGAIGGGIAGGLGFAGSSIKGMESFARSSTYGAMKGVASDLGVSAAMGNKVSFEGIASSLAGGFLDGAIPQFRGVNAGNLANLGLDLGISALRGGARGALSSALQGSNIGQGFINGAEGGFIGSVVTNAYFGAPKLLTSDEQDGVNEVMNRMKNGGEKEGKIPAMNIGVYKPTFRSGGLHYSITYLMTMNLPRADRGGSEGFAMGNSLMSMYGDTETSTHEFTHYYQQMNQGWARYFGKSIYEQWFMKGNPYSTKGTNEYNAQQNQLSR